MTSEVLAWGASLAGIFVISSCSGKLGVAEQLDLSATPVQVIDDVFAVQATNGRVEMRLEAGVMERYDRDSTTLELFPSGFRVYGYNEEGLLESTIVGDAAEHTTFRSEDRKEVADEVWKAYGNVVIRNVIKQETMLTDTILWDRVKGEIYTDCYVRMYAPAGFMQGYGMRSDDKARESVILRPFNSYGVVVRDSTVTIRDSANFIGPLAGEKW